MQCIYFLSKMFRKSTGIVQIDIGCGHSILMSRSNIQQSPAKTEEEQDQITVVGLWCDAEDKTQKAKLISSRLNRRVKCVNNDTLAIQILIINQFRLHMESYLLFKSLLSLDNIFYITRVYGAFGEPHSPNYLNTVKYL